MTKGRIFLSANLTVLGHFNPAILTHEFLIDTCGFKELGELESQSPQDISVVSEIVYPRFRWFMDLNRMIVENRVLSGVEEFTAPRLGVSYLEVLPHTPVTVAGINLNVDFSISDPATFGSKFNPPDVLIPLLEPFGASDVEIASHCRLSDKMFVLDDCSLSFNHTPNVRVSLQIMKGPSEQSVRAACNYEWRNLKTENGKLKQIAETYQDAALMLIKLTETILPEVPL
jgi:hypothetical protein